MSGDERIGGAPSTDELRSTLQSFQDGLRGGLADRRQTIVAAASAVAVVLLIAAYLLGRRGGRRRNSIIEIRRA
ncbi:MAG: hypothetical protein RIR49_453 [Actinomycetota bacterium]|jgi:hypothetical protein